MLFSIHRNLSPEYFAKNFFQDLLCLFVKNIYQKYFNEISLLSLVTELFLTLQHATVPFWNYI
jgi:hypothetical protein